MLLICAAMGDTIEVPEEIDGYKVTSIYKKAFISVEASDIILPDTIKTIGENAFPQTLKSLTISANCTEIAGDELFLSCMSLEEIIVNEGGDGEYSSENGVLYNKDKTLLIAYPHQKSDKTFTPPSTVKEVKQSACCYNEFIEEVDLSNVETIGDYAFEACESLKSVKLSKDLDFVGYRAFIGCTSLKSVRLYDKVDTIGNYAFGYIYDEALAAEITQAEDEEIANSEPFSVMEDFKIYTDEDSLGFKYASERGITVITNTVAIGSKNVDKSFLYVVGGAVIVLILGIAGIFTGKKISAKRKEKKKFAPKTDTSNENDSSKEEGDK